MDDLNPNNDDNKIYEIEPGAGEDATGFSAQVQKDKFLGGSEGKPDKQAPRPGKPLHSRPIRFGNDTYSGEDPPKLYRNEDGSTEYRGGTKLDQDAADEAYSARFWDRQPPGMREAMIDNIHTGAKSGEIGSFVDPKGISDTDREKLSAYRKLAKELGYEVGPYRFNEHNYTATATITKKTT